MVRQYQSFVPRWLAICGICTALAACEWGERVPTDGVVVVVGASAATSTIGVATEIYEYRVRRQEADDAIRVISATLAEKGWRPIERLWDDPNGADGSFVAGWRCAVIDGSVAHVWVSDWRDSAGNIVTYLLRETPAVLSDHVVVRVAAVDASVTNAMHIPETSTEQPVLRRESCFALEQLTGSK